MIKSHLNKDQVLFGRIKSVEPPIVSPGLIEYYRQTVEHALKQQRKHKQDNGTKIREPEHYGE